MKDGGDAVKLEKKKNEDGFVFFDAVEEYEFHWILGRLAPLELEFYGK